MLLDDGQVLVDSAIADELVMVAVGSLLLSNVVVIWSELTSVVRYRILVVVSILLRHVDKRRIFTYSSLGRWYHVLKSLI